MAIDLRWAAASARLHHDEQEHAWRRAERELRDRRDLVRLRLAGARLVDDPQIAAALARRPERG